MMTTKIHEQPYSRPRKKNQARKAEGCTFEKEQTVKEDGEKREGQLGV